MDNKEVGKNNQGSKDSKHQNSANNVYRFKVKNRMFETVEQIVTGRRICELAGLTPPESYQLSIVLKHGEYQSIKLDTEIDLSNPGVERFDYIKRDHTEG